ncbi:MAG: hypothetical protein RX318_06530 [bacterium]|nr:hypothetical protein [bacterium]
MKLGIVVVYLIEEDNEKLLDLHLHQIEKHTNVPYSIYGSTNRLLPQLRRKLEQHPKVKVCQCPTTDFRGREEHSFYLEHLVRNAIEDGSSHIVTLHVDSFPIRSDWIEKLASKLSDSCVLATIQDEKEYPMMPNTACLFFNKDFYLNYRPTFLPSREDLSTREYQLYLEKCGQEIHSGSGYVFKASLHGLSWHPMQRTNKRENHHRLGSIYDDLVFHLGAAARRDKSFLEDGQWIKKVKSRNVIRNTLFKLGSVLLSQKAKHRARAIIPKQLIWFFEPRQRLVDENIEIFESIKRQLIEDPEAYLNYLRTGKGR